MTEEIALPEINKVLVLDAFDALFNKRDYAATARFWSSDYIQHSAHIASGHEGLFNLIGTTPDTPRYERGVIQAEGDHVMAHGRFGRPYKIGSHRGCAVRGAGERGGPRPDRDRDARPADGHAGREGVLLFDCPDAARRPARGDR